MAPSTLGSLVLDRRFLTGTPGRVVLLLVLLNVAVARREVSLDAARKANLLLPASPQPGAAGARRVPRYDTSVGEHLDSAMRVIPDARRQRLVILAGMSQMYAINEPQPGDETISELLDDALAPSGARVFGLAAPNLGNEEALFLLLAALDAPATQPRVFVYALCFDKMRMVDLRPGYLRYLGEHASLQARLADLVTAYASRFPLATTGLAEALASSAEQGAGHEASFEERLRERIGTVVPMVRSRTDLNAFVMDQVLYAGRNKLLGITNTTKRPMIAGRYEMNQQFLLMMMDIARRTGIQLVLYINPLNPQAESPYVPQEYAAFKAWAARAADSAGVPFADLENAVPREDWGLFMGGPDFKHFKGAGHRRTAQALLDRFGPLLAGATGNHGADVPQ